MRRLFARLAVALAAIALVGSGIAASPAVATTNTFYYFTDLGGQQVIVDPIPGVCYPTPIVPAGPATSFTNLTRYNVTLYLVSTTCTLTAQGPYAPGDYGSVLFLAAKFTFR